MSPRSSSTIHHGSRASVTRANWVVAGLIGLVALLVPAVATAQDGANTLQSIDPLDGAALDASPPVITLSFNQEVADDQVLALSLACSNELQDLGAPELDIDGTVFTVAVGNAVPRGSCFVSWFLRNADTSVVAQGTSSFRVDADPPASVVDTAPDAAATTDPNFTRVTVPPAASDGQEVANQGSAGGAVWLGRLLSTLGALVLFGGLALIAMGWPEGPEYVVTVRFLRFAWLIGLLGTVLYLIAFAADFNDVSFGAAVSPSQWLDLKDAGWAGRGALLRLVFIGASGWVAMRPERIIDPQSAMIAWGLPGFALIAVSLSRVSGPAAPIGFVVSVAHVMAVAVWLGGSALVARVVLAGPGEDDLVQATRAFAKSSVPAILVTIVTGIIQMIRLDGGDLFSSSHGRVLLLKVVAVAAMLAVALAVRQQVSLRLDRAHELTVPLADRFRRAFHAEAALGVVVLAFSGWLLTLTPPKIDPASHQTYTFSAPFNDPTSGLQATVSLGPSSVGLNGFEVQVAAPAEGVSSLVLRFRPPVGSPAFGIEQTVPLTGAGRAYLDDSVGLPFTVPGVWTLELSAATATGVLDSATVTFEVTDEDGNRVTIPADPAGSPLTPQVEVIDNTTTTAPFATSTTTTTLPVSTTVPPG